jgi:hypothetical protein
MFHIVEILLGVGRSISEFVIVFLISFFVDGDEK